MRVIKEHDIRRNEILDTAKLLFISKGYDNTAVNDILKEIGIAKGTFYHYFKSKEEVMDAVIMRVVEQDALNAKEIVEKKELSSLDKIIEILLSQSSHSDSSKGKIIEQFKFVDNILMKQHALERSIEYICPILAEVIEEGNKLDELNTLYPLESIQFLVAGIQTLLDERMTRFTNDDSKTKVQSFINVIMRVLGVNFNKVSKEEVTLKIEQIFSN